MAKEKQISLRILQPAKKIPHPPVSYAVLGFCMGVIFSATELDTRIIKPDIHTHQSGQDMEYSIKFPQPQKNDLNKIFIPQDQSKLEAKSLNKTPAVPKETAVAP
jgi:hypothetical protein